MILFFDTETTGFAHKSKPIDHPDQPHVIQLAAILAEEDGAVRSSFSFLIDPGVEKGVRIPSGAAAVHGIDEERLWRHGLSPTLVLAMFAEAYARADLVVGHNVDFDVEMMDIYFARHTEQKALTTPRFCTMKSSTDICRIPSPRGGYKWPKLAEAYKIMLGKDLVGAHDAMNDVRAAMELYFHLKNGGQVAAPEKSADAW